MSPEAVRSTSSTEEPSIPTDKLYARLESIRDRVDQFLATGRRALEDKESDPPFLIFRQYKRSYQIVWDDGFSYRHWDPLEGAYFEGTRAASTDGDDVNPYPPGPLHDEWDRGFHEEVEDEPSDD